MNSNAATTTAATSTTTAATTGTAIHTRALLVWLTISSWAARKYDKGASATITRQNNATSDAARVNKMLLPGDCPSYKNLVALMGRIRVEHYSNSLAWSDEGWRLLPTSNYMQYSQWYRDKQREITIALDAFLNDYAYLKTQAYRNLGSLYSESDYPSAQDLRAKFAIDVKYSPLPAVGDVRVDLAADQVSAIEAQIQKNTNDAIAIAVGDSWQRLHDVVARISEKLNDPKGIFRDTLISNAKDICDSLRRLNVTNDPQLETMRARVAASLTQFDPDIIRETPTLRANVAKSADDILSAMSAIGFGGGK